MRSLTVLVIAGLDLAIDAALLSDETLRGCPGQAHDCPVPLFGTTFAVLARVSAQSKLPVAGLVPATGTKVVRLPRETWRGCKEELNRTGVGQARA